MKELYSKAKNIANSTGKSFSKLAMLTMLGTGLVVGSGLSKNVSAGDNVMSKGVHEMSPEEYSQYNYNKSTTDYHNTPEDERDESLQDYQLRTGWGVMDAEDKPKTKDDEVNEKRERRSGRDERDYHIVSQGETLYNISKKYDLKPQELKKINDLNSNRIHIGQKIYLSEFKENKTQSDYTITIYSTDNKYEAKKIQESLEKINYETYIENLTFPSKNTYYCVNFIQSFENKEQAKKHVQELEEKGFDAVIDKRR